VHQAVLVLMVLLGGALGAPLRFLVDRTVADRVEADFPAGTFVINVSGSLVFGILAGIGIRHQLPSAVLALVGTGLCGAYTTFSTWSFETVELIEHGEYLEAAINAGASLLAGLMAAAAGLAIGWAA
jgi:CrcB protein